MSTRNRYVSHLLETPRNAALDQILDSNYGQLQPKNKSYIQKHHYSVYSTSYHNIFSIWKVLHLKWKYPSRFLSRIKNIVHHFINNKYFSPQLFFGYVEVMSQPLNIDILEINAYLEMSLLIVCTRTKYRRDIT